MKWMTDELIFRKGKYQGQPIKKVKLGYLRWILNEASDGMEELEKEIMWAFARSKEAYAQKMVDSEKGMEETMGEQDSPTQAQETPELPKEFPTTIRQAQGELKATEELIAELPF